MNNLFHRVSSEVARFITRGIAAIRQRSRERKVGMNKQRLLVVAVTLLILLTVFATPTVAPNKVPGEKILVPQPTTAPVARRGSAVVDAIFADAVSLQPLLTNDATSSAYQSLLYAPLTRTDPETLDVRGNLYEDNPVWSADGGKLTWKLKQGLKWSDGNPLTAKDIEFTWNKLVDDKTQFPARSFFTNAFKSVKAIDDLTVEYTLARPGYCSAIRSSNLPGPIPAHVFQDVDINQNAFNDKPTVTSGLWQFYDWQRDDSLRLAPANSNYLRGEPMLPGYTYRIVKDNAAALDLFKNQEIDIIRPEPADWDQIKQLSFAQTFEYYPALASWTFIGFNVTNPLLSDKRVRQAMAYAVNKPEYVDKIRLGYAKVQNSNVPATNWAYTDDVPKFNYDVAKAKALLKEAGWTPGADGVLVNKDGKKFQVRLFYNTGNKQREQIAMMTQEYLKVVGISVEVVAEEFSAYLRRLQDSTKRDFEMFVLGWSGSLDPSDLAGVWQTRGSQNYIGYTNAEVDKLYDTAATVPGCKQDDRKKSYARIQQIIAEEQPYLFLYTNQSLIAVNKRIQVNSPTSLGISYNLATWQLAK